MTRTREENAADLAHEEANPTTLTRAQAHQLIDDCMSDLGQEDTGYAGLLELAKHWQKEHPYKDAMQIAIGAAELASDEDEEGKALVEALAHAMHAFIDDECACPEGDGDTPRGTDNTGLTAPDEEPLCESIRRVNAHLLASGLNVLTPDQLACLLDHEREEEGRALLDDLQARCGLHSDLAREVARYVWVDQRELHADVDRDADAQAVETALDLAVAHIQQHLGQTAGDFAGLYFSDRRHAVRAGLFAYLFAEREDMANRQRESDYASEHRLRLMEQGL